MKMFKIFLALIFLAPFLQAQKIGDMANIIGVRDNQLIGYGIVIGLNGSGDKSASTMQSMANMLDSLNIKVTPNDIQSKNVASVMITASLPAFARAGDKLDIKISSIGDAKSLEGGTLVMTPLSAVDGQIYALAQGSVNVGDANALSGSIINGASVERELPFNIYNQTQATLSLKKSNFQNAIKVQDALNKFFKQDIAQALDPRSIKVKKPDGYSMIEFLALVQEVDADYTARQKVVVDKQSGTIISGLDISVQPIVLTQGNLTLKITNDFDGDNNSLNIDSMTYNKDTSTLSSNGKAPTLSSVVRALQKLGASANNVISILEGMKASGAISADIEIM